MARGDKAQIRGRVDLGHGAGGLSHNDPAKRQGSPADRPRDRLKDGVLPDAWSRSDKLVTSSVTPSNLLVSLQKNFPEAGTYTIQFGLAPLGEDPSNKQAIECEALITWGAGGNSITRRVSVGNGVSISGTADSVRVVARDVSTGSDGAFYNVTILVTKGVRAPFQPPLLVPTLELSGGPNNPIVLAPGASHTYPVPRDAGATSVCVIAGTGIIAVPPVASIPEQEARVVQLGPGLIGALKSYDARNFEFVPLAPGCTDVMVYNGTVAGSLRFHVSFGIDG